MGVWGEGGGGGRGSDVLLKVFKRPKGQLFNEIKLNKIAFLRLFSFSLATSLTWYYQIFSHEEERCKM